MVYNTLNYPNLCAFFEELGVEGDPTAMGFSVSMDDGNLEWCSDTLAGLMATPSNITNPQFYLMIKDILRFNQAANEMLGYADSHPVKQMSVQAFLRHHQLSDAFRDYYLIPMTAAIWSASAKDMLNFSAVSLFTFLNK
jgi:predicted NAD/FAD-binding protein